LADSISAQITARCDNDHQKPGRIAIELMSGESQIPTASAANRFAARLSLVYSSGFGLLGTHLPYFPVWLKAVGVDAGWIGIITAVPAVTRFTVLPFVTAFAERRHALRGAIMTTAFATAIGLAVVGTQHLPLLILLAYAATCCLWTPMVPLIDAYALRGVTQYGLRYGPLRRSLAASCSISSRRDT
jgi:PPP family 3-phenylpropionic acid transporter